MIADYLKDFWVIFHSFTTSELLLGFLSLVVLLYLKTYFKNARKLPPGPIGLPVVGYLPFLKKQAHIHFMELSKKYDDIFSLHLGNKLVIVLNSYESIREALVKQSENFTGRPKGNALPKDVVPTIFEAEGEVFREFKRFSLTTLRDFGLGKLSLEPRIREELTFLLEKIESHKGQPFDISYLMHMTIANVISALIGKRFDYDDKYFAELLEILSVHAARLSNIDYNVFLPNIKKIPGLAALLNFKDYRTTQDQLADNLRKKLKLRAANHQPGNEDDFIETWFTEAERRSPEERKHFTNEHLVRVVESLFFAGTDTTANTLRWAILYLMANPKIQSKLHKEIDDVIGHERLPSMTDRDQMPYTEAILMEVQRIRTLVPLSLLHCNLQETTLKNYKIPKRSVVIPNLWAVHHNPKDYPEPEKFRPERFLNEHGKLKKPEKLIPFSLGKRQCLGESLARMELFIYLTSLLQRFTFQTPVGDTLSFDYRIGTVLHAKPFRTIATVRTNAN